MIDGDGNTCMAFGLCTNLSLCNDRLEKQLCRNRNRDGTTNQKKKTRFEKRFGVATIIILENYGKP